VTIERSLIWIASDHPQIGKALAQRLLHACGSLRSQGVAKQSDQPLIDVLWVGDSSMRWKSSTSTLLPLFAALLFIRASCIYLAVVQALGVFQVHLGFPNSRQQLQSSRNKAVTIHSSIVLREF